MNAQNGLMLFGFWSLFGWIFVLVGIVVNRAQQAREEQQRTRTTGTITGYNARGRASGVMPVVTFEAEGQTWQRQYDATLSPEAYPKGTQVEVLYNADDPESFRLELPGTQPRAGRILLRFGLGWVLISAAVVLIMASLLNGELPDPIRMLRSEDLFRTGQKARQDAGTIDGFQYTASGGSAVVTGYRGETQRLDIPMIIDGKLVTGIGQAAFSSARQLVEVRVPGTVRNIQAGAFAGCIQLSRVTLNDGVQSIGARAFDMCPSLADVILPASLTNIGDHAFPDNCAARFHVAAGSPAERWCRENGFDTIAGGTAA